MGVTERVLESHQDVYDTECSKIDRGGGQGPKPIHMLYAPFQFFYLCILVS